MNRLSGSNLQHLKELESESIYILRETAAEAENPAVLYSIGKDSSVLLHLARKAFYPGKIPFPVIHIDTTWKFKEMIAFRDATAKALGLNLIVHSNIQGIKDQISPLTHDASHYTDVMKTTALKQALQLYQIDAAIGGARRDEEKSRAKERIFSIRNESQHWDSKQQRPELWHLYHLRKNQGESFRVFPLSNWTELDVWQYIHQENIPVVSLYFAAKRPVIRYKNSLIMPDDERIIQRSSCKPEILKVRFRTLGCYPLTAAVESEAETLPEIIAELQQTATSERHGRLIDHDSAASMEKKKQEGYF